MAMWSNQARPLAVTINLLPGRDRCARHAFYKRAFTVNVYQAGMLKHNIRAIDIPSTFSEFSVSCFRYIRVPRHPWAVSHMKNNFISFLHFIVEELFSWFK